jgi:alpha/beta superfamily hydrolase
MSTRRVTIPSEFELEGVLYESDPTKAALLLHPHPLYGGSMENNVVKAMDYALRAKGFTTLRFNFRGVGNSGGSYGDGEGEREDARKALQYLVSLVREDAYVVVSGYSFGAWIAIRLLEVTERVNGLVLVAYPFSSCGRPELGRFTGDLILLGALSDEICPCDDLLSLYRAFPHPTKHLKLIPSSHFFWGKEKEIMDFLLDVF